MKINNIQIKKSGINFIINPQIELLSVIQIISGYAYDFKEYFCIENNDYIDKIKHYFSNVKDHDVIKKYRKMQIQNSHIMKYSFNADKLILNKNVDDQIIKDYLPLLNDFIEKSNFCQFFNEMKEYYLNILQFNIEKIKDLKLDDNLSNYYQTPIKINMISKIIQSDWGEYLGNDNNEFIILGGVIEIKEYPLTINERSLTSLAIHECTHPFVNKWLTTDYDLLAKTEQLFIILDKDIPAKQFYVTYNEYLEDTVVRAITAVLHYKFNYKNEEEYEYELSTMENMGFIYIKEIANIILNNNFYKSMKLIKDYLFTKANEQEIKKK